MDILEILRTIGICVGSIALVFIVIMLTVLVWFFQPPSEPEPDEDNPLAHLKGMRFEEFQEILHKPLPTVTLKRRKK